MQFFSTCDISGMFSENILTGQPFDLCTRIQEYLLIPLQRRVECYRFSMFRTEQSLLPLPDNEAPVTGAAYSFTGATASLTNRILTSSKKITLVRHGLSSWNAESNVQATAEIIWKNKDEALVFLDSLKEAHLFFLEGMTNGNEGENFLVVTHKSILRALICTALGIPPERQVV
ncbi:putative 2-carboxy-D-arabinitol-1-phosphatase [Zea mays]|uniref:Putative 2-carboxy-D-arabinitol-1-phosphatase n=1 Tax=Zea mays TaxID=4577 RepID=A0A1D6FHA6_MAIZE|nr:putative 2-carboxy-D-arabinitol-1-phosphatase [Zea mays]